MNIQEIINNMLAGLAQDGVQPGTNVPVKALFVRMAKLGVGSDAFTQALNEAVDQGLFTFEKGGVSGLGTLTLTEDGGKRIQQ